VEQLASGAQRFLNLLIDLVGYYGLAIVIEAIILLADRRLMALLLEGPGAYLFAWAVYLLYYVPSETLFGRTLGKLITRTRTVSASGATASFAQILGRTMTRWMPFEALTFLRSQPIGLHDKWSGTRVVSNRLYPET